MRARVTSAPSDGDWSWADVIVLVKRAIVTFGRQAEASSKPVVWDALDFWAQPSQNGVSETHARALLSSQLRASRPTLVIGATKAMATAAGGVYVTHHGHQSMQPTDARQECRVVGYEGNALYLDAWRAPLEAACQRRGWTFTVNPPGLSACDILVALRGGPWDGWICREWKSGVKLVNAILAGRPVLTQDCAAARELAPAGSILESQGQLDEAFDHWAPADRRRSVVEASLTRAADFSLDTLARAYLGHLQAACEVTV